MKRPRWADTYMEIAKVMAQRSTCASKHRVGAVLVNSNNYILATGYNGAPREFTHCDNITLGENCELDSEGRCQRAIHAEENILIQCAKYGIRCRNTTLYITHAPCLRCARLLLQADVLEIWYEITTSSNGLSILHNIQLYPYNKELT